MSELSEGWGSFFHKYLEDKFQQNPTTDFWSYSVPVVMKNPLISIKSEGGWKTIGNIQSVTFNAEFKEQQTVPHTSAPVIDTFLHNVNSYAANRKEEVAMMKLFPGLRTTWYTGECPEGLCMETDRLWLEEAVSVFGHARAKNMVHLVKAGGPIPRANGSSRFSLNCWVVHLNDKHRWPRAPKDNLRDLPDGTVDMQRVSIYDWLKEGVEKYGWDLSARPEEVGENGTDRVE